MDFIKKIVLISSLLAIGISILDMLYPNKKFTKQLRIVFSLIFIIGIFSPLVAGNVEFSFPTALEIKETPEYSVMQTNVEKQLNKKIEENISLALTKKLEANGIAVKNIFVNINIAQDNSISINEVNIISENDFDAEKAIALIKSEVGKEVAVIVKE
ncbi:MAG: stage III sporulation protein AF [Oscillospiraceae bacterium]